MTNSYPLRTRQTKSLHRLVQSALLGVCCATLGCAGQRLGQQAEGLAAQGRYGEAIMAFQEAQKLAPDRVEYAQRLAAVKSQAAAAEVAEAERRNESGELDAALAAYRRAAAYEETARITERIQRIEQERSDLALQRQNLQTLLRMRKPADVLRKCRPLIQRHLERTEPELTSLCNGAGSQLVDAAIARARSAEQSRDLSAAYKIMKEALEWFPEEPRARTLARQYGQKIAVHDLLGRGKTALRSGRYLEACTLLTEAVGLLPGQRETVSLLENARELRFKELLAQSKEAQRRSQFAEALLRLEEAQPLALQGSRQAAELVAQSSAQRISLAQALLNRGERLPTHSEGAAWVYRRMAQLLAPSQYASLVLPDLRPFLTQRLYIQAQGCTPNDTPPGVACHQEASPGAFHAALEQALASQLRERSSILHGLVELTSRENANVGLVIDVLEPAKVDAAQNAESVRYEYVERLDHKPNPAWEEHEQRRLPLERQRDTLSGRQQAEALRQKSLERDNEQLRGALARLQAQYDAYVGTWNQDYERKLAPNATAQELLRTEISTLEELIESKDGECRASEDAQQRTKLNDELAALRAQLQRKTDTLAALKQKYLALKEEQQAGPPAWPRAAELRVAQDETARAEAELGDVNRQVESLKAQLNINQDALEKVKAKQAQTARELAVPFNNTYWHHVNRHTHRVAATVLFSVRDEQFSSALERKDRAAVQALGVRSGAWPEGTFTGMVSRREEVSASDKSSERVAVPGQPPLIIAADPLELPSDEELFRELALKLAKRYVPAILPLLQHPSERFWVIARSLAQHPGNLAALERQLHFWVLTYHGAELLRDEHEGRKAAIAAIRQVGLDLGTNRVDLAALANHLRNK